MNRIRRWWLPRTPFHRMFPSSCRYVAEQVDKRVAVDHQRSFIYFRIPKAANSTVTTVLFGGDRSEGYTAAAGKRSFHRASDLSREEAKRLADRFFLFTFVRDPYARIASAYLDKVLHHRRRRSVVARYYGKESNAELSFPEFCRFIGDGGVNLNPHWFRQCDLVPCGLDKLHFLGRVESIESDLKYLARRILGESEEELVSWMPHRTDASRRMRELYCDETMEIVRTCYSRDFEELDYPTDPVWR